MSRLKQYGSMNVYDAAVERVERVYRSFDRVYLSVSFGKDSSVMLHVALDVARRLGRLPVDILYIDLEGQYRSTIEHAREMFDRPDVRGHWVCLPLNLRNAVSTHEPFWRCWDPAERDRWIRPMPDHAAVVSDPSYFPFYRESMEFEDFVPAYGEWFAQGSPSACMVGIRTDESLNRFRTIASRTKERFDDLPWTTRVTESSWNAYPIYDWKAEDIWTAVGKFGWSYNRIYDLMQMAGVPLVNQRICQPYGDDQRKGLDLFHKCEPDTWTRVVARVAGANFGAHYARSAVMGFRKMQKPDGHTWRSYSEFLLDTLPRFQAEWYRRKFARFFAWWEKELGITLADVPDEAPPDVEAARKSPSWRRICRCILLNDMLCRSLTFDQTVRQWERYQALREEFGE